MNNSKQPYTGTVLAERPPADKAILKALFDTLPVVFAKEEKGWTGITEKSLKRGDDHE